MTFLESVHAAFRKSVIHRSRPTSLVPELFIDVPDRWPSIQLAPLYDVHIGHQAHDAELFAKHLAWIRETPNVLTWNGGDIVENAGKLSPGSAVHEQATQPMAQVDAAILQLATIRHKTLFCLAGNHEDRTMTASGHDLGSWIARALELPYSPDFFFCTIRWRGQRFRLLAHHGTGSAVTAGAQRMAARRDIAHYKADLYWTGHLHAALVDPVHQQDHDQKSGRMFERTAFVVVSPSYLFYYGTYAARKRYPPGSRGLSVVELEADGTMSASLHARGRRL